MYAIIFTSDRIDRGNSLISIAFRDLFFFFLIVLLLLFHRIVRLKNIKLCYLCKIRKESVTNHSCCHDVSTDRQQGKKALLSTRFPRFSPSPTLEFPTFHSNSNSITDGNGMH